MNYYQFHIGDFRGATLHLTNAEELAYRRAIDWYYDTEKPIPLETQWVSRRLRVDTKDLETVLNDFFVRTDDGWIHERCEFEIAEYRRLAEKNRQNGRKGGRPPKGKSAPKDRNGDQQKPIENPLGFQSEPRGNRVESESNPNQEPRTINQEPISTPDGVDAPDTPANCISEAPALVVPSRSGQEKFPMSLDWEPSTQQILDRLVLAGIAPATVPDGRLLEILGEFRSYWSTRPDRKSEGEWQHKFLQQVQATKARGELYRPPGGGGRTRDRPLIEDLTDRSWAAG